ncbi:protein phosphatase 2C and cyclic nucleotide-binding/kinase domain-containing protein isoform X2 [Phragmites australis]|uniref:protein phosphatase 2C and cyclic nucleotide-binding/kinase domain-containing protein isoform X2 n=1 Tax=Phragmites australis TaxID=29695 RepID=UPI002D7A1EC5|nr:protein phosphatase 2C and cyclic nucleotide-binding/kinase domain-containing protein isoform X2 [Phragmites australis]
MGCSSSKCCSQLKGCLCSNGCLGQTSDSPRESRGKSSRGRGKADSSDSDASSDDLGEDDDALNQMNITRESNVGINRLSRVSSQFLPPDSSRKVRVPLGNYDLRYSYLSQRGYYPESLDKPNQDSFCIHTPFGTSPDDHFFGVFDGHGEYGAQCSQFVKRRLCENLLRDSRFRTDAVLALHSAFVATNSQLHADNLDDSMSGTTAITILVRGKTMYIANTGDSRAVIAEKRGDDIVAVDLSIDQTPYRSDELERVKECGARVLTLDQIEGLKNSDVQCWGTEESDDGDPPRLWVQNGMYPGTAFTRSIGDSVAESIGVIADPEIFVLDLNSSHPFLVLASDGVFEFLSSQTVVDMISKYKDPRDACAEIVAESYRLWLQYETRTDDITIIVVHINGLNDMESTHTVTKVSLQPSQQVVGLAGSESPLIVSSNTNNQRSRHDLSRARLRALESSLENGQLWVPPSPSHRKTWEEQAHIERVLHDHFLFRKLTDTQCHVLLDCMQRVDVKPGDIVVQQGGEGDCFYVVGSGEYEVLAIQEEDGKEMTKVLHRYTADKLSSFGELALMHNKPLQASVRAVTSGTLWALKREDFRAILMSEFSNIPSLKLLRSVELFTRFTVLQLSQLAESLVELSFADGQIIVDKNDEVSSLYIIQRGHVRLILAEDQMNSDSWDLISSETKQIQRSQENGNYVVEIDEGGHFGEWALIGETISFTAISVGDVTCSTIAKEKFNSIVGPLPKLSQADCKIKESLVTKEHYADDDFPFRRLQLSDLEWKMCIYAADCSEIGLVQIRGSDKIRSLKRFYIKRVKDLHKEVQVFDEKDLMKSLSQSTCVPEVLCTCADQSYLGILLNCCLCCSLASILHTPLNESSAQFFAASVVVALEKLHQKSILYRGVSADILMLDRSGHLQLVDFRFGKKLEGERTYTICGIADSLAPEIVLGRGHGFAADWWALGVLIYFMLQSDMPFGSWRESELEPFAKIAKGHLVMPSTFSVEVVDLITKLLVVDENARLGTRGAEAVKKHPWFDGIDWERIAGGTHTVPKEITDRINSYIESLKEDSTASPSMPSEDPDDLTAPEWIQDW